MKCPLPLDFPLILCNTKIMKTNVLTFRSALNILETEFNAIYQGSSTVREMISDLTDAISWENESPDKVYHRFETESGPNRIVADDQVISLALHYV